MLRQIKKTAIRTAATATVVLGTIEITTKLPSEGRSSEIYHKVADQFVTPFLRTFFNPENAHNLAIYSVQKGLAPTHHPNTYEYSKKVNLSSTLTPKKNTNNNINVKKLTFPNCIGLAAGFDKDGIAIQNLMDIGFGFVEIGSVTPKPQPGNPKPRMFRLVEDGAVINRFGFNSVGMDVVEDHLRSFRGLDDVLANDDGSNVKKVEDQGIAVEMIKNGLKTGYDMTVSRLKSRNSTDHKSLLGVNLGKNKTSTEEVKDYEVGIEKLGPYADYLVINISSPNTPGLRDLQQDEPLKRLLQAALTQRNKLQTKQSSSSKSSSSKLSLPPLFVKIAPDLTDEELQSISTIILQTGIDGILVTNTTNARPSTLLSNPKDIQQVGGLSGRPLHAKSTECIRKLYKYTNGSIFIIGIGGVSSGKDVYEKLKAGASVVQLYTGMVYEGPGLVSRIRKEVAEMMVQNGQRCVEDVIGLDHEEIYWDKRMMRLKDDREKENVIIDE